MFTVRRMLKLQLKALDKSTISPAHYDMYPLFWTISKEGVFVWCAVFSPFTLIVG